MYIFFRSMIYEGKFTWLDYIWFLPAIIVGISTTILYLMMDEDGMTNYVETVLIDSGSISDNVGIIYRLHHYIGVNLYHLAALVQIVGASIFAIVGLRKYHRRLCDFYSDADEKSISVDNKILNWFIATIPLSLALIIPDIEFWEAHPLFTSLLFVAWAVVYFALLYYGSQKRHTVDNFIQDLQQADREENRYNEEFESSNTNNDKITDRPMPNEVYERLAAIMTKLIDQDQIYLKNDLRLDEVAQLMYTNRAYVSKVIKNEYNCSFSSYINGKRIEFSMDLMRLDPSITQEIIAEKSGFINAQSYSRTFKKMVGTPPKEWQNRNILHS